jgi:preprotein translocase subunit SecG
LEAVIVPLKVQYKSTLPLTNPKAVVNQKYKAVPEARGFYPFFLMNIVSVLQVIWSLSALGLVVFVLLHSPKGDGIGGIGGQAQLFTSAKSAETSLNRITWGLSIVFMGLTVILSAGWLTPKL